MRLYSRGSKSKVAGVIEDGCNIVAEFEAKFPSLQYASVTELKMDDIKKLREKVVKARTTL